MEKLEAVIVLSVCLIILGVIAWKVTKRNLEGEWDWNILNTLLAMGLAFLLGLVSSNLVKLLF